MSNYADEFAQKVEDALYTPPEDEETPAVEEEPVEVVEEEPVETERLYAGKYKTVEEMEAAYGNLQSKMGEQGSELGQLRQRLEEVDQRTRQTQQPQYSYSQDQVMEAAEQNPQQTAVWALQNAPHFYDTVMEVWYESQPRQASRFEQSLVAANVRDEIRKEFEPMVQPAQDLTQQQAFYQAWGEVANDTPDITNYSQAILETAEQMPEVLQALKAGNIADKKRIITSLFWMARGRGADTLSAAQQQAQQQAAKAQQKSKAQAAGLQASGRPAPPENDRLAAWRREFRAAAGLPEQLG